MRTCDYCGRENPDVALNCSGCASQLREEPLVIKQTRAGFWIRVAARLMDTAFTGLLAGFVGEGLRVVLILADRSDLISTNWEYPTRGLGLTPVACFVLAGFLYRVFCEGLYGTTLGKLCCGLCVISEDGRPSTVKGAVIRNLAYILDSQFFGGVAYTSMKNSPLNQRYGDVWGRTAVIKSREVASETKRSLATLFLALGLGITSYIILVGTGLLLKIWEASNSTPSN